MMNSWFVVFCNSDNLRFSRLFTRKGFEHCYCFSQGKEGSVIVNYNGNRVLVSEHPMKAEALAFGLVNEGLRVLNVRFYDDAKPKFRLRGFTYCVSVVKSILGLSHCFSLTPYQLWRWLKSSDLEVHDLNEIDRKVRE